MGLLAHLPKIHPLFFCLNFGNDRSNAVISQSTDCCCHQYFHWHHDVYSDLKILLCGRNFSVSTFPASTGKISS